MNQTESSPEVTPAGWAHLSPPIFARCVTEHYSRYDASRPFVVDGHLYATDGRVAVRMPVPAGWDVPNPEKLLGMVGNVFRDEGEARFALPVPAVEDVCSWCGGSGRSAPARCECPDCGCDIDRPERPCDNCGGAKVERSRERVMVVPGYWIARGYAAILREHGVETIEAPRDLSYLRPARFALGEIEGRVMPMTPPEEGG